MSKGEGAAQAIGDAADFCQSRDPARRSSISGRTCSGEDKMKLTKLSEKDDIEAYLTMFERMMVVYEVPVNR